MSKKLQEIHENVSPDHYDLAIKKNILQKIWHLKRYHEIKKIITPISGNMLDVGCHSGLLTKKIMDIAKPEKVYGIDISAKAINKAKKRIKNGYFKIGDAHKLPYKDNFFGAIFCLEMIEHVDFPQTVIQEIFRVLKNDGYVVFLIPTDNLLFKVVWFLWNLRYPVWKHVHVQSFKGELLEKILEEKGFDVQLVRYFNFKMLKIIMVVKR